MSGRMVNRMYVVGGLFGAAFGFVLTAARLTEYDTIHRMLRLDEFDVFLLMGAAIGVSLPLLWWLERRGTKTLFGGRLFLSRSKPERHHVIGGAMFGAGWAIAGTCPAPSLGMLASGAVLGAVAIAGLFLGITLRDRQVGKAALQVGEGDGESNSAALTGAGAPSAC